MESPFDADALRDRIEDHKGHIMANPWKCAAYENLTQESCIQFWIEQIGDAEMYEQRWHELEASK